jgi:uncharacterized protein (DUF1499 family)
MPVFSFSGTRPNNLGIKNSQLAQCSSSPNCVSSDATDAAHQIAPFALTLPVNDAWLAVRQVAVNQPRTKVISVTEEYLYAECSSAFFGFVDDLELHLRLEEKLIAVRSAARLGYSDFGVNRRRVENLRSELTRRGAIR